MVKTRNLKKSTPKSKSKNSTPSKQSKISNYQIDNVPVNIREPHVNIDEYEKSELDEARSRFYGALKGMPAVSSQEPSSSEESLNYEEEDDNMNEEGGVSLYKNKRRKNHDDQSTTSHPSSENRDDNSLSDVSGQSNLPQKPTFIMKLFDRSLDLCQFDDKTPMYVLCRSWIQDQPKKPWEEKKKDRPPPITIKSEKEEPSDNKMEEQEDIAEDQIELKAIYVLPPPTYHVLNEIRNVHIPDTLPVYHDDVNLLLPGETKSLEELPSQEELILGHLTRWKIIKGNWIQKAQLNESRFEKGKQLLLMMNRRHNSTISQ